MRRIMVSCLFCAGTAVAQCGSGTKVVINPFSGLLECSGLASIADQQLFGNVSGAAAAPGAITSTQALSLLKTLTIGKWVIANSGANFLITNPDGTTSTVAKAAAVTQSVTVFALPAQSVLGTCIVKPGTAFTGTTTLTATLGVTGTLTACVSTPFDLQAAVSNTNFTAVLPATPVVSFAGTNVLLALTSTINNLSSISAGSVTVWLVWYTLP